jgi:hypothetical protein
MRTVALACALALVACGAAVAATGQSPHCRGYCIEVEPASGPEGSVFVFRGTKWRPERRVRVNFGAYCRPGEACPAIGFTGLIRTNERGRFTFRLRADGDWMDDDADTRVPSGGHPSFQQRARGRTITRTPRYEVTIP